MVLGQLSTSMKLVRWRNLFIVIGTIILLIWLLGKSRELYFGEHQRYSNSLSQLRERYAILNQDMLKARYNYLTSYDVFVKDISDLKAIQKELEKIPDYIEEYGRQELKVLLSNNAEAIARKEQLIEQFKSQNAILKNSLRYLPVLTTDLRGLSLYQSQYRSRPINELIDKLLLYNFTSDEEMKPTIKNHMNTLLRLIEEADSEDKSLLEIALAHSQIIITYKPRVDDLIERVMKLDTRATVDRLTNTYNFYYQEANETIGYYQLYTTFFVIIIVGFVAYIVVNKFRIMNREIKSLNRQLKTENIRLTAEVEVTRRLQQMILPAAEELHQIPGLDISGFMEPAEEVGGDYYDVLTQNGRVKIAIGDVTGHGLESGVLAIMVQTAVRTLLEANETDFNKFLSVLNRTIYNNVQRMNSDKNLTLCLLDYQKGMLRLSGQHENTIVVRYGGNIEVIDTIDLGFPIGLEEEITDFVAEARVLLKPGEAVVLYTDGITEAEDNNKVQYGLDRLCNVVKFNWKRSADEIRQAVIKDLRLHIGTQKVYDDITLLVLKQK